MTYGIYHRVDLDGVACAAILKIAHPDAILIPYQYGDDMSPIFEIPIGSKVYMMDVSLPLEAMVALAAAVDFTWIDHHRDKIVEVVNHVYPSAQMAAHFDVKHTMVLDESGEVTIDCFCDTSIAACELAYQYFKPEKEGLFNIGQRITLLGKYDTWRVDERWEPETKPFQYAMRTLVGLDVDAMCFHLKYGQTEDIQEMGVGILKYQKNQEAIIMKNAAIGTLVVDGKEYGCIAVNADGLNSDSFKDHFDTTDKILLQYSFQKGKWKIGMRATSDIDVGKICKRFGGGGHPKAAGCFMDSARFYDHDFGQETKGGFGFYDEKGQKLFHFNYLDF